MKRTILSLSILALGTGTAFAQMDAPDFATLDADQSGLLSFEEVTAAWPALTVDAFGAVDANADGTLDEEEFAALVEATSDPAS